MAVGEVEAEMPLRLRPEVPRRREGETWGQGAPEKQEPEHRQPALSKS